MSRSTPLPQRKLGWHVIHLSTVSSTNDYAKRLARSGQAHGTVVVADEQTRGRGQRGRRWASPLGGLWASILVRPSSISTEQVGLLNVAAATAAAEAVAALSGARIALKWPNDLLLGGHKVGGVLVETAARAESVIWPSSASASMSTIRGRAYRPASEAVRHRYVMSLATGSA